MEEGGNNGNKNINDNEPYVSINTMNYGKRTYLDDEEGELSD